MTGRLVWSVGGGTGKHAGRRGHGEDAISFDAAKNRYVGAISVGFGCTGTSAAAASLSGLRAVSMITGSGIPCPAQALARLQACAACD